MERRLLAIQEEQEEEQQQQQQQQYFSAGDTLYQLLISNTQGAEHHTTIRNRMLKYLENDNGTLLALRRISHTWKTVVDETYPSLFEAAYLRYPLLPSINPSDAPDKHRSTAGLSGINTQAVRFASGIKNRVRKIFITINPTIMGGGDQTEYKVLLELVRATTNVNTITITMDDSVDQLVTDFAPGIARKPVHIWAWPETIWGNRNLLSPTHSYALNQLSQVLASFPGEKLPNLVWKNFSVLCSMQMRAMPFQNFDKSAISGPDFWSKIENFDVTFVKWWRIPPDQLAQEDYKDSETVRDQLARVSARRTGTKNGYPLRTSSLPSGNQEIVRLGRLMDDARKEGIKALHSFLSLLSSTLKTLKVDWVEPFVPPCQQPSNTAATFVKYLELRPSNGLSPLTLALLGEGKLWFKAPPLEWPLLKACMYMHIVVTDKLLAEIMKRCPSMDRFDLMRVCAKVTSSSGQMYSHELLGSDCIVRLAV